MCSLGPPKFFKLVLLLSISQNGLSQDWKSSKNNSRNAIVSRSRRTKATSTALQEQQSCSVSSAQQALAGAMRATTQYQKAARGLVGDYENASPGGAPGLMAHLGTKRHFHFRTRLPLWFFNTIELTVGLHDATTRGWTHLDSHP